MLLIYWAILYQWSLKNIESVIGQFFNPQNQQCIINLHFSRVLYETCLVYPSLLNYPPFYWFNQYDYNLDKLTS